MKKTLAAVTLAALLAAGCGTSDDAESSSNTDNTSQEADATMISITGELAYRERIALIPGGTATVALLDTSKQDVAAQVITETTIGLGDQQVPIPFDLEADVSDLDERGTYSVRATITGPGDDLQWTTDTANIIDVTQSDVDLEMLMLVRAGEAATAPGDSTALVGEWTVTEIDATPVLDGAPATLVFGDDGTLGGNTGCNSFSATYSTDGDALMLDSEMASTLMACDEATNDQETAFFEVMNDLATYEIADGGTLTITSNEAASIVAER